VSEHDPIPQQPPQPTQFQAVPPQPWQPQPPTGGPQPPQQPPYGSSQPPMPSQPSKKKRRWPWIAGVATLAVFGIGGCMNAITAGSNSANTAEADPSVSTSAPAPDPSSEAPTTQVPSPKSSQTQAPKPASKPAAPKPKPAPPKPKPAVHPSQREWAKVVKSPDKYVGMRYVIYGEMNQFDSATGDSAFLADSAFKNTTEYGYFDGQNTWFDGDSKKLEDFVEGDVFRATVTVTGSYSYDTQIGGNTTVPKVEISSIKRVGHNG
jgi:hypothetical protein